jgi:hypothetical protein
VSAILKPSPSVAAFLDLRMFGWFWESEDGLTHARNIFAARYKFEGDQAAIS